MIPGGANLSLIDEAIAELHDAEEAKVFFQAMLTRREYTNLQSRWALFQLKNAGLTHREIVEATGLSNATVTRASGVMEIQILGDILRRCQTKRLC